MYDIPSEIINKIKAVVNNNDYYKGYYYYAGYIKFIEKKVSRTNGFSIFRFNVESERNTNLYDVLIKMSIMGDVIDHSCTCAQHDVNNNCKHVAACLIKYYENLFVDKSGNKVINMTKKIFEEFSFVNNVKKELNLEVFLYNKEATLKIGFDKLYSLNNKFQSFITSYKYHQMKIDFGKHFVYDPNNSYFNIANSNILSFFINNYHDNNNFTLKDSSLKHLLDLLKNKPFYYYDFKITDIYNGLPIEFNLTIEDNNYELLIDNNFKSVTSDLEYIFYKNKMYHLNMREANFLNSLVKNHMDKLIFTKDSLNLFSKSILPIIKNNLIIDDNIDIELIKTPLVKLYFDINLNKIICNPKFTYNNITVDYFETSKLLRDIEFEESIVAFLKKYNFKNDGEKIYIDEIEDMGDFLEIYLSEISNIYEVYTSTKLKETNILKNPNITSTFKIGKDNILNYFFDLGPISESELKNIYTSISEKKKYYRLKNGDLLNLNDNSNLMELKKLRDDLDIKDFMGTLPKYKAIYLDSLNYSIINKDNKFNELIERFNKYKDIDISVNDDILRDYQVTGVKWLYNIDKSGFGGILADEMGLGKSIQTLYYIKQLLKDNKDNKFLIVVPTSLVYNWENEILKFDSSLSYEIINGTKKNRINLINNNNKSILITTYGLLREDIDEYENYYFKTVIIDEAQNIKNPTANTTRALKRLKSDTKIALTGTPIENSIIELWSIFDFIMPGFLSNLTKFKSKYQIKDFDETSLMMLENLNKIITPFILRRKKKDVIKDLPEKLINNIYIDLNKHQKEIYVNELAKVNKEINESLKSTGFEKSKFMILKLLTRLRQIAIDPSIIFDNYDYGSSKIDTLIDVIEESISNNHKILIFTSFKSALNIVKNRLEENNISSYVIDGSVNSKDRMNLVNKFNIDDTNVFLIMLKSGGTGLNLTSASVVIHLDLWWNPQAENQATDRVHRIGQEKVVEVVKLITKGTIEEKILELQDKKKLLNDKLIDSKELDSNIISTLTEKEIRYLLQYENKEN